MASFSTTNGTTTVTFTYATTTARMQATIFGAAEYIHGLRQGQSVFSDLTTQQKLDIVDSHIKNNVINMAKEQHVRSAEKTAQDQAVTEAETNYGL